MCAGPSAGLEGREVGLSGVLVLSQVFVFIVYILFYYIKRSYVSTRLRIFRDLLHCQKQKKVYSIWVSLVDI